MMPSLSLGLNAPSRAAWWPAGAVFAADFAADRYRVGGQMVPRAQAIAFARPSPRWAADSAGVWHAFGPDEPAITDRGLQILPAARNDVPNAAMVGARTDGDDALSGLPTSWIGFRFDGVGIRGRVVATGTERGLPTIDVRLDGPTAQPNAEIIFQRHNIQAIPVVPGDSLVMTCWIRQLSGSLGTVAVRLRVSEINASGGYLTKRTMDMPVGPTMRSFTAALQVSHPSAVLARGGLELDVPGGHDVVLRIAAPVFAKAASGPAGPVVPILTSDTALALQADALRLLLPAGAHRVTIRLADGTTLTRDGVTADTLIDPAWVAAAPITRVHAG